VITRAVGRDKPVEHRKPTFATVRQLYGTAFACAKPGCPEPLYKVSEATGRQVLNSRVAHIHARSEGGPRWNPSMSEADNRSASNLLLLCLLHAWEIDDVPDQYPAELLRTWKRDQLADYEHAHRSWSITEQDAREAVAPFDLHSAIEKITEVVPFNPRMRTRVEAWQLAVRRGSARRITRLTPLVPADRRAAVLAWMAGCEDPIVEVPAGQVRVLVARLGAGKTEQATRWWEQGLQAAAHDPGVAIPLFFTARQITSALEAAVVAELGGDPARGCRVVIDDLDGVSGHEADRLLTEARELVHVWPDVSVLATARPGIPVPDEEKIEAGPWPAERGAELTQVALGDAVPWHLWTAETAELLTSPLTALGLAARVHAGRDTKVSRAQLLSELAAMVVNSRSAEISDETWQDLARLAVRILGQPHAVPEASFHPLPRLRRLVATSLVVTDNGTLSFALPVFEQYFGAEALRSGLVSVDAVAAARSFPRWRYALAFAIASAPGQDQEALLVELARVNPAALFWVLDEIGDSAESQTLEGASDEVVAALIQRRDPTGSTAREPDLAIRAGMWLREAEKALLRGLGPLAQTLARHRDGQLVQWGVWLQHGYLSLARARDRTPPPEVVALTEIHPKITASGWQSWTQLRFPTTNFGRWLGAGRTLRERLDAAITRRTLPVPRTSWLARERTYLLATFVHDYNCTRRRRPIDVAELRERTAEWMERVNTSQWSTWRSGTGGVDSDDIRWLAAQLALEDGDTLQPPWPEGDLPHAGRWAWQRYSPELTLTIATGMVREALVGYRQLVESSFPAFGDAMGLYSMLPVRVEGLVGRFDDDTFPTIQMRLILHPDPTPHGRDAPTVDLRLVTGDRDQTFWEFGQNHQRAARTAFGHSPLEGLELPLHVACPASSLAYRWLARDLSAVGWLKDSHRFLH
jgi:hypothetical protein